MKLPTIWTVAGPLRKSQIRRKKIADRLPVLVRIPAGPLGSLKCDPSKLPVVQQLLYTIHQNAIGGVDTVPLEHSCRRAMPTPIIRILLAGRRTTKVEHSAVRIHLRARNADTNQSEYISGREDRESRTQCHQNTIGGRAMPTPIIRIRIAGGTAKAGHSSIRMLLAGAQCQDQL